MRIPVCSVWLMGLAIVLLGTSACQEADRSLTSATSIAAPPAYDLTGEWAGEYEETACQSTACPVCCTSRGKGPTRVTALALAVSQVQGTVSGTWRATAPGSTLDGTIAGDVRGTVLSLRGSLSQLDASGSVFPGALPVLVANFSAQLTDPNAAGTGSFVLVELDSSGKESMRLSNQLVTLRRR